MPAITFSGIASGIDADAIIKTVVDARRLQSEPLRAKVAVNETENKAIEEFSTKLLSLNDILKDFLTLSGASVSKIAQSSNEDAVGATVGSSAIASTSTLRVLNLAKAASASFSQTFSDLSAKLAPNLTGPTNIEIKVGTGATTETFSVEVNAETTVSELVDSINNTGSGGKAIATLVNVGSSSSPQYKIVVGTTKTGIEGGNLEITVPNELSSSGALNVGILEQAEDAVIQMDSIGTISRATNSISDLIPGVTLNLKQESSTPIVITVGNDSEKTTKRFAEAIAALNEVIKYANDNSKITRVDSEKGPKNEYGSLARTRVDNQAIESIKRALSASNSGILGSAIQSFSDMGIKTERDGTLVLDEKAFMKAVSDDPEAAARVLQGFADKVGSQSGVIADYTKFKGGLDVSKQSNDEELKSLNDKLLRIEEQLEAQTQALRLSFSRLEQRMAQLNSNADALSSLYNSAK